MSIAIIGGTGLRELTGLSASAAPTVATRFGDATVTRGQFAGREVWFLCRHGERGQTPPHRINYRANIAALQRLGVTAVVATTAVGTLAEAMPPGTLALSTQFIDFTKSRATTFFDETSVGPVHVDLTSPFCATLIDLLQQAAAAENIALVAGATYACAEGPRFETPAEIRMLRVLGADLVGMTLVPEVVLAREAGICYANLAISTNWAAGIAQTPLSHHEVHDLMCERGAAVVRLLQAAVARFEPRDCACQHSLDGYDFSFTGFLRNE